MCPRRLRELRIVRRRSGDSFQASATAIAALLAGELANGRRYGPNLPAE
jgi:hypothetical protein